MLELAVGCRWHNNYVHFRLVPWHLEKQGWVGDYSALVNNLMVSIQQPIVVCYKVVDCGQLC